MLPIGGRPRNATESTYGQKIGLGIAPAGPELGQKGPLHMTEQIRPTHESLLLRQVGEVLFGASWQTDLCRIAGVSDRSMRRWGSGQDSIPPGVWRDIQAYARGQWLTIKYFDEQITPVIGESKLHPIPNTRPMPDSWGLAFALATTAGRPVRCYIRREVLDDRVSYQRMIYIFDYFSEHAEVFYRVAQRKFDAGEFDGDGRIVIGNVDVSDERLPDVRGEWRAESWRADKKSSNSSEPLT